MTEVMVLRNTQTGTVFRRYTEEGTNEYESLKRMFLAHEWNHTVVEVSNA